MTADNCQTCGHTESVHSRGHGRRCTTIEMSVPCPCTAFTPVAAPDDEPCACGEDHTDAEARAEIKRVQEAVAAREAAPEDPICTRCGNNHMPEDSCYNLPLAPAPAREAAQAEVTLTADEKAQIDGACIIDWKRGWSGIHPDRHAINAIVEDIIADRLAGRGHE